MSQQVNVTLASPDARFAQPISASVTTLVALVRGSAVLLEPRPATLSDDAVLELVIENGSALGCTSITRSAIVEMGCTCCLGRLLCLPFCPAACPATFDLLWTEIGWISPSGPLCAPPLAPGCNALCNTWWGRSWRVLHGLLHFADGTDAVLQQAHSRLIHHFFRADHANNRSEKCNELHRNTFGNEYSVSRKGFV